MLIFRLRHLGPSRYSKSLHCKAGADYSWNLLCVFIYFDAKLDRCVLIKCMYIIQIFFFLKHIKLQISGNTNFTGKYTSTYRYQFLAMYFYFHHNMHRLSAKCPHNWAQSYQNKSGIVYIYILLTLLTIQN